MPSPWASSVVMTSRSLNVMIQHWKSWSRAKLGVGRNIRGTWRREGTKLALSGDGRAVLYVGRKSSGTSFVAAEQKGGGKLLDAASFMVGEGSPDKHFFAGYPSKAKNDHLCNGNVNAGKLCC